MTRFFASARSASRPPTMGLTCAGVKGLAPVARGEPEQARVRARLVAALTCCPCQSVCFGTEAMWRCRFHVGSGHSDESREEQK
jgi:hypothetical protein